MEQPHARRLPPHFSVLNSAVIQTQLRNFLQMYDLSLKKVKLVFWNSFSTLSLQHMAQLQRMTFIAQKSFSGRAEHQETSPVESQ